MDAIETPCTKVCVVDPVSRLCRGCGRSLNEIASWTSLSAEEQFYGAVKDLFAVSRRRQAKQRGSVGARAAHFVSSKR